MRKPSETSAQTNEFDAVVIGAGFAGIHALPSYACSGFAAGCTRRATASRGAWYGNRYPVRCDSESWFYCFTFSDELLRRGPGRSGPAHDEIRRYLDFVDRLGLRPDMRSGRVPLWSTTTSRLAGESRRTPVTASSPAT